MVVLGKKDLNISYQVGKKRQFNESLSSLVINLGNEGSDEMIFEKDPKTKNERVVKRPKLTMEKENESEDIVVKKTEGNVTPMKSIGKNNEANAYSTELEKEEHEKKGMYNSPLFWSKSEEEQMIGFSSNENIGDADASFIDCLNGSQYSFVLETPEITSTPLKEKCGRSQISTSQGKDTAFKYQFHDNLPIVPRFNTKGVYLNEKRKFTPYSIDRLDQDSFLFNDDGDDLNQCAISSSVVTIIDSD